ncbi:MAG: hypothetical protein EBZ77_02750, partial [Chitinophagia bacterium]|nr:hypothetical protein [Chitinophagia bacterium]
HIEVLAMPRDWATQCEQWCSQAGLQLVRLEPPWQASLRWQTYAQNHSFINDIKLILKTIPALFQKENV